MNVLAISYFLPPTLTAQAIVIGKSLFYLSEDPAIRLYVATSAPPTSSMPTHAIYTDFEDCFADVLRLPDPERWYVTRLKSLALPFIYEVPDPRRGWMSRMSEEIEKRWGDVPFDAVITFAFPHSTHLVGMELKQKRGIPWIAYFSDPWAHHNLYANNLPPMRQMNRSLEKKVITEADQVVFSSPETERLYQKIYPGLAEKSHTLEHAFDPRFYRTAPSQEAAGPARRPLLMRYIGSFYRARTPQCLFKALQSLSKSSAIRRDIRFEIIGGGWRVPRLIRRYGLEDWVVQKPSVVYEESIQLMETCDVLVVIDADASYSPFLPSKLIEYLGAQKPLLGITPEGSAARLIRDAHGWVSAPNDTEGIIRTFQDIIQTWKENRLNDHKPSTDFIEQYRIEKKITQLKEILHGC